MMRLMRDILLGAGFGAMSVGLFIVGLIPTERILTSDHCGPSESYILVGTGRAAAWAAALCEFILGAAAMLVWMRWRKTRERAEHAGPGHGSTRG
jgi:hypothetical protein